MGESSRVVVLTWAVGLVLGVAGYQGVQMHGQADEKVATAARAVRERASRMDDVPEATKARLIAAMVSQDFTKEDDARELVRTLVAHPDFINTLFDGDHPEERLNESDAVLKKLADIDSVLKRLASDCPTAVWTVVAHARFGFDGMLDFRNTLERGARATPEQAFEAAGRMGEQLGNTGSGHLGDDTADYIRVVAVRESQEAARMALEEVRAGKPLTKALEQALLDSDVFPEGKAQLPGDFLNQPEVRASEDLRQGREMLNAWLHGAPLSDEDLKEMPVRDSLRYRIDLDGLGLQSQRLEALARVGDQAEIDTLLGNLVMQGRSPEAAALADGANELPLENRDKLLVQVATNAYEWTGDPQGSLRALDAIADGAARQAAEEDILSKWAGEAPGEARDYLPQVKDEALRAKLGEIIEQQSRR